MKAILRLLLILSAAAAVAAHGTQTRYHDFGATDDVDETAELRMWPQESLRIGGDPAEYIQYESKKKFYWATTPSRTKGLIASRVVKAGRPVEIRAAAFRLAPDRLHLQVRFKDHLLAPASVWYLDAGVWRRIGELGGAFDHQWKSADAVADVRTPVASDGTYRFRLGAEDGSDLTGEIPVDYVRLADAPIASEPPAPGFFPRQETDRWSALLQQGRYPPDGEPVVPIGLMVTAGRVETWRQVSEMGVPMISLVGWNNSWRAEWEVFSDGTYVDRVKAGLPEWLATAEQHELRHLPVFNTDNLAWFIRNVYGDEKSTLRVVRSTIRANRGSRALLAWAMKTRTDSDTPGEGCPLEYAVQLGNLRRKHDPTHPSAMLFDGLRPESYRYFAETTDIVAVDRYPFAEGRPLSWLGEGVSDARRQVGDQKAVWAVIETYSESGEQRLGRRLTPREVVAQAYTALVNGARGFWFFVGSSGDYVDPTDLPEPMKGVKQFAREMRAKRDGIAKCFLPPYETVDVMGERGKLTCANPAIHHVLTRGPGGTRYLIAVNTSNETQRVVQFESKWLTGGRTVVVLFEKRVIAATPGTLTDDFRPLERHVYRFLSH